MTFNTQKAIQILQGVAAAVSTNSLGVAQTECRKLLVMINRERPGVVQYERSTTGYRLRVHHGPLDGGYDTWGFQFRWVEDALEWLGYLQELGYEWENDAMAEQLAHDVLAEQKNDDEMLERANWIEEHDM